MGKSRLTHGCATFDFTRVSTTAIARNAPCPCGSGKRFKDCHGTTRSTASAAPNAEALLREAQVALAEGRPERALALLHQAIALEPGRAELLRERARVEWMLGHANAAATCREALASSPADIRAWTLLGEILRGAATDEAERAWRRALELDPRDAEALFLLGNCLRDR